MMNERQLRANRANARASTGPRSAAGKKRASQNARRHGLSLSIRLISALSEKAEKLARDIAGEGASPEIIELARAIADAEVDLMRVRRARLELLTGDMKTPNAEAFYREWQRELSAQLAKILIREGPTSDRYPSPFDLALTTPPDPPQATLLEKHLSKEFAALYRYERRALSRRKSAIRDFDGAEQEGGHCM